MPLLASSSSSRAITLPNNWTPRPYQIPTIAALDAGKRRAVSVWHRRAGKDACAMNFTAKRMYELVASYWHVLPTQRQARRALWEGINPKTGIRYIDQAFPPELRKRTRDDEMMIEFQNGSIWRLVGGDAYDGLVGANVAGVTWSEWSLTDPRAWDYIRPIMAENDGWAWFIFTPRGHNHGYKTYLDALKNPNEWHTEVLDITKTGAISLEAIEKERRAGMPEELIQQEFYCSWDANLAGAVYGKEMSRLLSEGRIAAVPYDPRYPVETAWDIGVRDATTIWFVQRVGREIRLIDYYEKTREGLPHFAGVIHGRGYSYIRHIGPHDLEQTEWGAGATKREIARQHGIHFTLAPKLPLADGIEATRALLPRLAIDADKCARGVEALRLYRREWDDERSVFDPKPVHDWCSHACDALRALATMPEGHGVVPGWAQQLMQQQHEMMGHSGGPPLHVQRSPYDPLQDFAGYGRPY